jgi:hypothetical protein
MPRVFSCNTALLAAIVVTFSFVSAAQQCPEWPQQTQCDPGDGSSCSTNIYPPPPYDQSNGPWLYGGLTECCGTLVPAILNVGPEGCYSAELRTPASRRNLLALIRRDDAFVLTCTNEIVRFVPAPNFRAFSPQNPSLELPIRFEFPGGKR